mgnify:CR=1 FL=1
MKLLRSLLFVVVVVTSMVVAAVAGLPLLALARRRAGRLTRWFAGYITGLLRPLCGVTVELRGLEHLQGGPVLIAAKHQSALETYVLTARLPDASFVLKREIVMVPLVGWYISAIEPIAVDRGAGASALRSMVRNAKAAVARGRSVVIFPEGTRTRPGQRAPYHPGVAALYGELGLPVVPMALNTGHVWPRKSLIKHPGRATLAFLEPIPPGMPRRAFLSLLEERIEAGCLALENEISRS